MAITSTHPQYAEYLPDWRVMNDTHAGERVIKEATTMYLPATTGMNADGMNPGQIGYAAYTSYLTRARFPDVVNVAARALVGLMHTKPPSIELPKALEDMRTSATNLGESLEVLLRRINEEQLVTGRIGLLLDVPTGESGTVRPYIATYGATAITNWDDSDTDPELSRNKLNMVVLDETGPVRVSDFDWENLERHRVLKSGDKDKSYRVDVYENGKLVSDKAVEPEISGKNLDFIPFTFINSADIVAAPDKPPLLGLSALSLGIYRGEADYRQTLFLQSQDTLVVIGVHDKDASFRTGAGGSILLNQGGDAKFIGVGSAGLGEMRQALENDKMEASNRSGDMVDSTSRAKESGDALRIRVAARAATLNQVALTAAFGLEQSLKQAAVWVGANPDEVIVAPNLDFVNDTLGGEELVKLATAKSMGMPLSLESIHAMMAEKNITKMTLEEETAAIEAEAPLLGSSMAEDLPDEDEDE